MTCTEPRFIPGQIGGYHGDPCDTNHPGPHSPEVCIHTVYDHDACCYLPGGCLGGCTQPGGCMDPVAERPVPAWAYQTMPPAGPPRAPGACPACSAVPLPYPSAYPGRAYVPAVPNAWTGDEDPKH